MQQLADIPNPYGKATLYAWNGKFMLKLENSNFEQTYKISQTEVANAQELIDLVSNQAFMEEVGTQFVAMNKIWQNYLDR